MILLVHHRYRLTGGEERVVGDLAWLIRSRLGEEAQVLERDSAAVGRAEAALGLLAGGLRPRDVERAVRLTGARVVHAHNLTPTFGWRALAAARAAGVRVVVHLHNYRLVCAVGTCWTRGEDCTRCHGRNTWPGVRLNCRGGPRAEAAAYGAGLALWQRRLVATADAFAVPSAFALARLRALGAPLADRAHLLPAVQRSFAARSRAAVGSYVLAAGRLVEEKGFADAIDACRLARLPLVVAGDGPDAVRLHARAAGAEVRFTGTVAPTELDRLRVGAAVAVVPSRWGEVYGLTAVEAMAAGLPVAAARAGALPELVPEEGLYPAGDVPALAERLRALWRDAAAGERALVAARAHAAPDAVASALRDLYAPRIAAACERS